MEPRAIIARFFIIVCNQSKNIKKRDYFKNLSRDDEINYSLFERFAEKECSSTMLCLLCKMGYFEGNVRLIDIISRIVEARYADERYYENDAVGASHNSYDVETGCRKMRIEECQVRKNIKYLIKLSRKS